MVTINQEWFDKAKAYGDWIIAKEDKRVDHYGAIIFTEQLLGAERVGYSTSHIVACDDVAAKKLGFETGSELVGKRILHRDYIKDAWKLGPNPKDDDKLNYFILKYTEVMAVCDEDVVITSV